jgi:hypothetical protein
MLIHSSKPLRPARPDEHPPLDARNPASILVASNTSNTSNTSNLFLISIGNIKEVREYGEYRAVARPWPRGSKPCGRIGRIGRNNYFIIVLNALSCVQCKGFWPLRPIYLDAVGISCVPRIEFQPFSHFEAFPTSNVQSVGFPRASRWSFAGSPHGFHPEPRTGIRSPISLLFTLDLGLNLGPKRRVPAKCAIRHARTGQPMGWRIRTCARPTGFQCTRPEEKSLLGLHDLNGSQIDGGGVVAALPPNFLPPFSVNSMSVGCPSDYSDNSSRQKFF